MPDTKKNTVGFRRIWIHLPSESELENRGFEQALEHRWITGLAPDTGLGGEYMVELSSFNDRQDLALLLFFMTLKPGVK